MRCEWMWELKNGNITFDIVENAFIHSTKGYLHWNLIITTVIVVNISVKLVSCLFIVSVFVFFLFSFSILFWLVVYVTMCFFIRWWQTYQMHTVDIVSHFYLTATHCILCVLYSKRHVLLSLSLSHFHSCSLALSSVFLFQFQHLNDVRADLSFWMCLISGGCIRTLEWL